MIYDVAVIGVGVVGSLVARALSRYRLTVCLLEKEADVGMGATRANSAIVHGGFDPIPDTQKARLNVRGTAMMPKIAKELHIPYQNNGSMVAAFSATEEKTLQELYRRGVKNGVPGLRLLNAKEALSLEPNLSKHITAALLCESSGIICPYELTVAAAGNAMDNGTVLKTDFAVTEIKEQDGIFTFYSADDAVQCRYAVNCAGLYADEIAGMVGENDIVVTPKKGEYLLLDKQVGNFVSHTIFQVPTAAGKGVLVTPTVDGNLLVGPTSHIISDKEDRSVTADGIAEIQAAAEKSVDRLPGRQVIRSFAGLRASVAGDDFILRPDKKHPRFIHTIGIDSPGLSAAPAIAEEVVVLLKNAGLELISKADFQNERIPAHTFREMSLSQKNAVIAKDPRYGHIVCRCETVTEGEIVAAIHQNPPARTVDAVKRRTRAGMGRCQGGFCTAYVTELLAKELGISEEQVVKSGKGSYLLVGKTKQKGDAK